MTRFSPTDERQLAEIVAAAVAREEPMELVAGGSKRGLGRPMETPHVLDLSGFAGIRQYEPAELVMTAGAATPLAEIEAALDEAGQMLAFEPADWRALLGTEGTRQTLAGVVACNLAGPRRIRQGAARDHFLGFRGVSGRGDAFKAGGRVVKNVTGYDLCKLMAGSHGTLAALTEISIKVLPRPEATRTITLRDLDDATALTAMIRALNSSHELSGGAHLPADLAPEGAALTAVRVEGPVPSVEARAAALEKELASFGPIAVLRDEASVTLWRTIRDAAPLVPLAGRAVWRISVPPTAAASLVATLARGLDFRHFYDWGGGLVWLAVAGDHDGGAAAIRAALAGGGHATLLRAPEGLRAAVPVFQPQPPAIAALTARVKDSFDPRRVLNRGRMYLDL